MCEADKIINGELVCAMESSDPGASDETNKYMPKIKVDPTMKPGEWRLEKDPVASNTGKSYWWCPNCKQEVDPVTVTFSEKHQLCGHSVEAIIAGISEKDKQIASLESSLEGMKKRNSELQEQINLEQARGDRFVYALKTAEDKLDDSKKIIAAREKSEQEEISKRLDLEDKLAAVMREKELAQSNLKALLKERP